MVREKINHEGHEGREERAGRIEAWAAQIVDAGLAVHRALGPGLLESTYEHCLAFELESRGLSYKRQIPLPIVYHGHALDAAYRLDILVEGSIIIEIKAVEALTKLHEAQIMTYLKLSGHRIAFLMNFNAILFKHGLRRFVR